MFLRQNSPNTESLGPQPSASSLARAAGAGGAASETGGRRGAHLEVPASPKPVSAQASGPSTAAAGRRALPGRSWCTVSLGSVSAA